MTYQITSHYFSLMYCPKPLGIIYFYIAYVLNISILWQKCYLNNYWEGFRFCFKYALINAKIEVGIK